MCVCVCVCVFVFEYNVYVCMCVCVCLRVCVYAYVRTYACDSESARSCTYAFVCVSTRMCEYAPAYVCVVPVKLGVLSVILDVYLAARWCVIDMHQRIM
jgi:hypothetical protein